MVSKKKIHENGYDYCNFYDKPAEHGTAVAVASDDRIADVDDLQVH